MCSGVGNSESPLLGVERSYISKGIWRQGCGYSPPCAKFAKQIWRQGIGSFVRNSSVSTLCQDYALSSYALTCALLGVIIISSSSIFIVFIISSSSSSSSSITCVIWLCSTSSICQSVSNVGIRQVIFSRCQKTCSRPTVYLFPNCLIYIDKLQTTVPNKTA